MDEINILLLGEPGVGKSTFIKSFINYIIFANAENAYNSGLHQLSVELSNTNFDTKKEITKKYYFPTEQAIVRIIDTPGIDFESNEDVISNIFEEISVLKKLNAICFLVKSSLSRSNATIEHYLKKTVLLLDTPVINNFIFVFTYGKIFNYTCGQAQSVLQGVVASIAKRRSNVNISVNDTNCFCIDNEAFINLTNLKNKLSINKEEERNLVQNWYYSSQTCKRLIDYIKTLKPYRFLDVKTVTLVKQFFKNNSVSVLETCMKTSKLDHKCRKIKHDLDETTAFLKSIQLSEDLRFSEQEQILSRRRRGSTDNELDTPTISQQERQEKQQDNTKTLSNHFNDKSGSSTGKHNLKYAEINHCTKSNNFQTTLKMNPSTNSPPENIHKVVGIIKKQQSLIQNVHDVFQSHKHEDRSLLKKIALFAEYLHKNDNNEDIFKKQIISYIERFSDSSTDAQSVLNLYEKAKNEIKETNLKITPELIEEISINLEKHSHFAELFEKIFNV